MPRSVPTRCARWCGCLLAAMACAAALAAIVPASAGALPWTSPPGAQDDDQYLDAITGATPPLRLVVSAATVQVSEAGSVAHVNVRLASAPDRLVAVTILADVPAAGPDRQVRAVEAGTALEFDAGSWNQARPVAISAIDDDDVEPSPHVAYVTLAIVGSDAELLASTPIEVQVTDDDTPGVLVESGEGGDVAVEGGASSALDVRLATRPIADVTVEVEPGRQLVASTPRLTFTPQDWNAVQSVRIGATQDDDVEGDHTDAVRFALRSDDVGYASGAVAPDARPFRITDDDRPAIAVTPTGAETRVAEGGAGDAYGVRLLARPTSTVRVAIEAGEDITVSPTTLEFAPDAWATPQRVTVEAVDDDADERHVENAVVRHLVDGDQLWRAIPAPTLRVAVTDDDDPEHDREPADGGEDSPDGAIGGGGSGGGDGGPGALLVGGGGGAAAAGTDRGDATTARPARAGADDVVLPRLASRRKLDDQATAAASGSADPTTFGDRAGSRAQAPDAGGDHPAAGTRRSWIARTWKQTVPATAAALGLGGVLLALMSDPVPGGRRRPW